MSGPTNLSDDDIELLKAIPMMAGAIVVTLGTTGIVEAGREMLASARAVADAVHRFPDNPLVTLLHAELNDVGNHGRDPAVAATFKTSDPMVAMAAFVEQLDLALNVLDAKVSPADADGYKRWILACAEASAEAAKEGGLFGIGGQRVSDKEAVYLTHLRNRLDLTS
ncbi:MAG: hypothetical protein OEZ14_07455 [Acidimicrobiia bacterium]|nr:hypothetical protein [Acidimicrobiia bacterium]